jgi:hypothetical protein
VDQLQPEPGPLVQQRPQLRAVAAAEIEGLFAAIVVVVGDPSLSRAVDGVQLADQRQVIGAIVAALDVPRIQPRPRQRAVDPAATRARSHQACHQQWCAPAREAVRVQRQLDRERVASRLRRWSVDQRAQRLLPRRRLGRRRDLAHRAPVAYCPAGPAAVDGGDHDRRDVLAVVSHWAGAFAVVECQRAVRIGGKERGRVVQRALADHRSHQRVGVRVPLDRDHPVTRVPTPALEGRLSHGRLDLGQLDVAQLCYRTQHEPQRTPLPGPHEIGVARVERARSGCHRFESRSPHRVPPTTRLLLVCCEVVTNHAREPRGRRQRRILWSCLSTTPLRSRTVRRAR